MDPAETSASPAPQDSLSGPIVVLHVDDDETFRDLAAGYIETVAGDDEGTPIEVVSAESGEAALQRIEEGDVDCVVSDYAMTGMTGLELIEEVRPRWPDMPFILLTGKGSEEIAGEAIRAGVDDYMQKQSGRDQFELLVNRIRTHVAGKQARESYRELFETATVGLTVHDPATGAFLSANPRALEMVGASEDELREMTLPEVLAKGESMTLEDAEALIAEVAGGAPRSVEWHVGKGEEMTCMDLVLKPAEILGQHRIVASIFDITPIKQREAELRSVTERLRTIVGASPEPIVVMDASGDVELWNPAAERTFGWTEEEMLGRQLPAVPDDRRDEFEAIRQRVLDGETVTGVETQRFRKDGDRIDVNLSAAPLRDDDGEVVGEIAILQDVTQRKAAERALEGERTRFRRLVEQVEEYAIFMLDPDGNVASWNKGAEKIKGYTEEEILGEHVSVFYPEEDVEAGKAERVLKQAVEHGTYREEGWRVRKDGSRFWASVTLTALTDDDGELTGFTKVTRDLTERREQERRYEAVFDQSYQYTGVLEPDGTILEVNRPALEFGGLDREDVVGKKLWDTAWFDSEEVREAARQAVRQARDGETVHGEFEVASADGPALVDFTIKPVLDDQGDVDLLVIEGRDVTEERQREQRLQQAEMYFENATDAFWIVDPEDDHTFRIVRANPALADHTDLDPAELEGRTYEEAFSPEFREQMLHKYRRCVETGEVQRFEQTLDLPGMPTHWRTTYIPIVQDGEVVRILGMGRDIGRDKEHERELERTRERFETITETIDEAVFLTEIGEGPPETAEAVYTSPRLFEMFDIDPDTAREKLMGAWLGSIHPEDRDRVAERVEQMVATREPFDAEYRAETDGGEIRWFRSRARWVGDEAESGLVAGVISDITEQKERETRLKQAESFFNNADEAFWIIDPEGGDTFRIVRMNPAYADHAGLDPADLEGKTLEEAFSPDLRDQVIDNYHRVVEEAETISYTEELDFPGMPPYWDTTLVPIVEDGEVVRILGIGRDVTEERERRRELERARERFKAIAEVGGQAVWVIDPGDDPPDTAEFAYVSPGSFDALDIDPADSDDALQDWFALVHPDDRERLVEALRLSKEPGEHFDVEYRMRLDGTVRWFRSRGAWVPSDGDGDLLAGVTREVTDRKEHGRELERTEARFRAIVENIDAAVWLSEYDPEDPLASNVVYVSPRKAELLGADPDEVEADLIGAWLERLHPDDRDRVLTEVQDGSTGPELDLEYRVVRDDGSVRWLRTRMNPVEGPESGAQLLAGISEDVTEDKERELLYREASLAFEHADEAMWVLDVTDPEAIRYLRVNPAWADAVGRGIDEVEGKAVTDALGEELADAFLPHYRRCVETGEVQSYEEELDIPGAPTYWRTTLAPVIEDGEVVRVVGIARNITESKMHEAELQLQNERLAKFASVVSHDLRNPLTVAQGNAELLEGNVEDQEKLEAILESLDRAGEIIEDTLTWARTGQAVEETEPTALADLAQEAWDGLETRDARLDVATGATIDCDASMLQQLLENLFVNAVQHAGSDVTVTVGDLDDGFYVEDDGPGIPEDKRDDVFEGGYTTSEEGLGFGLSIVDQIAKAHGWDVEIVDAEGGGARFEIRTDGSRLPV